LVGALGSRVVCWAETIALPAAIVHTANTCKSLCDVIAILLAAAGSRRAAMPISLGVQERA
jgi:hypothetical protein